uniref:OTU domain-containing protein n=1 Tax=Macrostomum lignano TaxID=282301 RepID=A0A1I8F5T5_9PLAT
MISERDIASKNLDQLVKYGKFKLRGNSKKASVIEERFLALFMEAAEYTVDRTVAAKVVADILQSDPTSNDLHVNNKDYIDGNKEAEYLALINRGAVLLSRYPLVPQSANHDCLGIALRMVLRGLDNFYRDKFSSDQQRVARNLDWISQIDPQAAVQQSLPLSAVLDHLSARLGPVICLIDANNTDAARLPAGCGSCMHCNCLSLSSPLLRRRPLPGALHPAVRLSSRGAPSYLSDPMSRISEYKLMSFKEFDRVRTRRYSARHCFRLSSSLPARRRSDAVGADCQRPLDLVLRDLPAGCQLDTVRRALGRFARYSRQRHQLVGRDLLLIGSQAKAQAVPTAWETPLLRRRLPNSASRRTLSTSQHRPVQRAVRLTFFYQSTRREFSGLSVCARTGSIGCPVAGCDRDLISRCAPGLSAPVLWAPAPVSRRWRCFSFSRLACGRSAPAACSGR